MNTQPFTANEPQSWAGRTRWHVTLIDAVQFGFLLLLFVGLTPFSSSSNPLGAGPYSVVNGGDAVRQFSYVVFFILTTALAWRAKGWAAFNGPVLFLPMLLWCLLSTLWSFNPDASLRRAVLEVMIVTSLLVGVNAQGFERSLAVLRAVIIVIVVANWISIPLIPTAIHLPGDPEPSVVGDWRGLFGHKNTAGGFYGAAIIVLLFDAMRTRKKAAIAFAAAAIVFLVMTRSKTSLGFLPVALFMGWLYHIAARKNIDRAIVWVGVALAVLLGMVALAAEWSHLAQMLVDPDQFTGRGAIWQAELAYIANHFWLGSGFGLLRDPFGAGSPMLPYIGSSWILTVGGGAHNGYLELFVTQGFIGFLLGILALVIAPIIWFATPGDEDAKPLLFALFCFGLLHNLLESDFFGGSEPQWVIFIFSLALLRIANAEPQRKPFKTAPEALACVPPPHVREAVRPWRI